MGEYARTVDLISGQTAKQPFGAPDSGCVYRSVPCGSSIANSVETGLDRRGLKVSIERLVVAQDAPGDARQLVGQGDGERVPVQSLRCRLEPRAEAISGPSMPAH